MVKLGLSLKARPCLKACFFTEYFEGKVDTFFSHCGAVAREVFFYYEGLICLLVFAAKINEADRLFSAAAIRASYARDGY